MISSFGRGFDSLQLHFKANESSDYQSFFFLSISLFPHSIPRKKKYLYYFNLLSGLLVLRNNIFDGINIILSFSEHKDIFLE